MLRSKGKKHVCSFEGCGKSFDSRWSLTRHVRIHTGEKPHVCTFPGCNKGFVERSALTRHLQTHSDDKPFECHLCYKRFKCKEYLDVHLRTHEDTKNFQCSFPGCGRIYSTRRGLRKHRLKAHDTMETKSPVPTMPVETHVRQRVPRTPRTKKSKASPPVVKSLEKCIADSLLGMEEGMTALRKEKAVAAHEDVKLAISKMDAVKADLKMIAKYIEKQGSGVITNNGKKEDAQLGMLNAFNTPFGFFAANAGAANAAPLQHTEAGANTSGQLPFSMAMDHLVGNKNRNNLQVMADDLMNQRLVPDDLLEDAEDDDDDDEDDDDDDVDDEDEEDDERGAEDEGDESEGLVGKADPEDFTSTPGLPIEEDLDLEPPLKSIEFEDISPGGKINGGSRKRPRKAITNGDGPHDLARPVSVASEIQRLLRTALPNQEADMSMGPSEKLAKISSDIGAAKPVLRQSNSQEQIFRALLKIRHSKIQDSHLSNQERGTKEDTGNGTPLAQVPPSPSVESVHDAAIVMSGMRTQ